MLKELSENTPSPCGSYDLNLGAIGQRSIFLKVLSSSAQTTLPTSQKMTTTLLRCDTDLGHIHDSKYGNNNKTCDNDINKPNNIPLAPKHSGKLP